VSDLDELEQRLFKHLGTMRAQTGLDLNREHFEIHIHPTDWVEWLNGIGRRYGIRIVDQNQLLGFPVITNREIEHNRPELRCTWKLVI
jgi:hypothetical protein